MQSTAHDHTEASEAKETCESQPGKCLPEQWDCENDDRDIEPVGTKSGPLSRGDDKYRSQLDREHRPDGPVRNCGESLPALCGGVRLDDEDWEQRQRRREDDRLKRRVNPARVVLCPHGFRVRATRR